MVQATLFHFQLEELCLWTTRGRSVVAFILIEGIAAFIQAVDNVLAPFFLVVVLLKAIWTISMHDETGTEAGTDLV